MGTVSEIKLIRTDTTLDLSQKAEKVCEEGCGHVELYEGMFDLKYKRSLKTRETVETIGRNPLESSILAPRICL